MGDMGSSVFATPPGGTGTEPHYLGNHGVQGRVGRFLANGTASGGLRGGTGGGWG